VPTAKQSTDKPGEHPPTPATLSCRYRESGIIYLDSISGKRVRQGLLDGKGVNSGKQIQRKRSQGI